MNYSFFIVSVANIFILNYVSISQCKSWQDVGKTLKFLRNGPEPGERREVITINSQEDNNWPKRHPTEFDPVKSFEGAAKRVRRQISNGNPNASFVSFKLIILVCCHKQLCINHCDSKTTTLGTEFI